MQKYLLILLVTLTLTACQHVQAPHITSDLQQGQRDFDAGYYKRAMQRLLPVACDGNAKAQYAVGYMYYYGYGVTQDTHVGAFWIERAAHAHYQPAEQALQSINSKR